MGFLRYPAYLYYVPQTYLAATVGQTVNENATTGEAQPTEPSGHINRDSSSPSSSNSRKGHHSNDLKGKAPADDVSR